MPLASHAAWMEVDAMDVDKIITLLFIGKMLFHQVEDMWADNLEERRVRELLRSMDVWCQQYHGMDPQDYMATVMKAPEAILKRVDSLMSAGRSQE